MHRPAAVWSKRRKAFICPDCDSTVEMAISKDGSRYIVDADQFFFKRQNRDNHKCANCGAALWAAVNPSAAMAFSLKQFCEEIYRTSELSRDSIVEGIISNRV